jgi:hypothetical protein
MRLNLPFQFLSMFRRRSASARSWVGQAGRSWFDLLPERILQAAVAVDLALDLLALAGSHLLSVAERLASHFLDCTFDLLRCALHAVLVHVAITLSGDTVEENAPSASGQLDAIRHNG